MSTITLLPHPDLCPTGLRVEARRGSSLCDALLAAGIEIEHACEKVAACATCHIYVHAGAASLTEPSDEEEDQLDAAWGLQANSRLACCVQLTDADLTVELPTHTRNHARE
jgi:2Fe-2S ferredoxin